MSARVGAMILAAAVTVALPAQAACPVQGPRTPPSDLGGTSGQCAKARATRLSCSGELPQRAATTQGPRVKVTTAQSVVACVTAPRPRMVGKAAHCVVREQRQRLGEIDVACRRQTGKGNPCPEMRTQEIYRAADVDGRATYCWVLDNTEIHRAREYRLGVDFRPQTPISGLLRALRLAPD